MRTGGFTFAYARATLGRESNDPTFEANRAGARAHGLRFGGYHLPYPGNSSAEQQAEHFLSGREAASRATCSRRSTSRTRRRSTRTRRSSQGRARRLAPPGSRRWRRRSELKPARLHEQRLVELASAERRPDASIRSGSRTTPKASRPSRIRGSRTRSGSTASPGHVAAASTPSTSTACPNLDAVTIGSRWRRCRSRSCSGAHGPAVVRLKHLLTAWSQAHPPAAGSPRRRLRAEHSRGRSSGSRPPCTFTRTARSVRRRGVRSSTK